MIYITLRSNKNANWSFGQDKMFLFTVVRRNNKLISIEYPDHMLTNNESVRMLRSAMDQYNETLYVTKPKHHYIKKETLYARKNYTSNER